MNTKPIEILYEGTDYVGYHFGKEKTRQKNIEKALKKLLAYVKGQK